MDVIATPLGMLLTSWGVVTGVLIILLIYRTTLHGQESEAFYINKKEEEFVEGDQKILSAKMGRLKKVIFSVAVLSGVLLLSSATLWVYIGISRG